MRPVGRVAELGSLGKQVKPSCRQARRKSPMPLIRISIALILGHLALAEACSASPTRQVDDVLRQKVVGIWSMKTSIGIASVTTYTQVKADGTYSVIGKPTARRQARE